MFNDPLFILVVLACGVVAAILLTGIATFGRGGAESGKRSNRLMRWRIAAQFVAVLLILLFVLIRRQGGQ